MSRRTIMIIAGVVAVAVALAVVGWLVFARKPKPAVVKRPPGVQKKRERPSVAQPAWPLTGLPAPSSGAVRIRVVSVKIENSKPARPQAGLADADIVYELLTEGRITRFNALFHSKAPDRVGPVRSARLSDIYIVPQYRALFARAGANTIVNQAIKNADLQDMNYSRVSGPYQRSSARRAPHNLYLDIPELRDAAVEKGFPRMMDPPRLEFGAPRSAGATANVVTVNFGPDSRAGWRYDSGSRRYQRTFNGSAHGDEGTNAAYSAANVIVLFAETIETDKLDVRGAPTLDIRLIGSGNARVFRGGRRYDGKWQADRSAPPRFETPDGQAIPLAKGPTWIEVVPTDLRIDIE